jgi:hypothetical protein
MECLARATPPKSCFTLDNIASAIVCVVRQQKAVAKQHATTPRPRSTTTPPSDHDRWFLQVMLLLSSADAVWPSEMLSYEERLFVDVCTTGSSLAWIPLPGDLEADSTAVKAVNADDSGSRYLKLRHRGYYAETVNILHDNLPLGAYEFYGNNKIRVTEASGVEISRAMAPLRALAAKEVYKKARLHVRQKLREDSDLRRCMEQFKVVRSMCVVDGMDFDAYLSAAYKKVVLAPSEDDESQSNVVLSSTPTTEQVKRLLMPYFSGGLHMIENRQGEKTSTGLGLRYVLCGGHKCPLHGCVHDSCGNTQFALWDGRRLRLCCFRKTGTRKDFPIEVYSLNKASQHHKKKSAPQEGRAPHNSVSH